MLETKISQETLAEIIGATRARVSFFMNRFRSLGFIDYNRRLLASLGVTVFLCVFYKAQSR